jgi:outer membrane lipoprotein carrier protein
MTTIFALILVFLGATPPALPPAPQAAAPAKDLNGLIDSVDKTFASMKDFSANFIQISKNSVNQSHQDEGLLYLTRDKKMRVEYGEADKPFDQLWVSNGTTLYTYVPGNRQVTKVAVKDSTAEQFPIMFLLGRSGLRKEFRDFRQLKATPLFEGDTVIQLTPNRKSDDVQSIEIEVNPRTSYIDRMKILFTDKASTEFVFMNIEINRNLPAEKFEFTPPAGVRVVEGSASR